MAPQSNQSNSSNFDLSLSDNTEHGLESSLDPTFTSLKMQSDRGAKRQKRSSDLGLGGILDIDRSHELTDDLQVTSNAGSAEIPLQASLELPRLTRIDSIENFERPEMINLDDCFLEREPTNRGHSLFMGLALVFGALGIVSSIGVS